MSGYPTDRELVGLRGSGGLRGAKCSSCRAYIILPFTKPASSVRRTAAIMATRVAMMFPRIPQTLRMKNLPILLASCLEVVSFFLLACGFYLRNLVLLQLHSLGDGNLSFRIQLFREHNKPIPI